MSFALGRKLFALIEEDVDCGRVLEERHWCHRFDRKATNGPPIHADLRFFIRLDIYVHPDIEEI
jgi:hypothetical protein